MLLARGPQMRWWKRTKNEDKRERDPTALVGEAVSIAAAVTLQ
jgi:hypothetical protein